MPHDGGRAEGGGGAMRRATLPQPSEKVFTAHVRELLAMCGYPLIFRDSATNAPRKCPRCGAPIHLPRNPAGWPDLFGARPGRAVALELKVGDGRLSAQQRAWLEVLATVRRVDALEV